MADSDETKRKKVVMIELSDQEKAALVQLARDDGRSQAGMVRRLIVERAEAERRKAEADRGGKS